MHGNLRAYSTRGINLFTVDVIDRGDALSKLARLDLRDALELAVS